MVDPTDDFLWTEDDKPLPEDAEIYQAHPLRSGRHDLYSEAMRLVGAKRSKYALVDLVNWLLHQRAEPKKKRTPGGTRGCRLPEGWQPQPETVERFQNEGCDALAHLEEFTDYWRAAAGRTGVKVDWEATFRTWIRRSMESGRYRRWKKPLAKPPGSPVDEVSDEPRAPADPGRVMDLLAAIAPPPSGNAPMSGDVRWSPTKATATEEE